jgi:hypothetical protein
MVPTSDAPTSLAPTSKVVVVMISGFLTVRRGFPALRYVVGNPSDCSPRKTPWYTKRQGKLAPHGATGGQSASLRGTTVGLLSCIPRGSRLCTIGHARSSTHSRAGQLTTAKSTRESTVMIVTARRASRLANRVSLECSWIWPCFGAVMSIAVRCIWCSQIRGSCP